MPTSLYSEGAMRNSIVVDLAHDLAEYYGEARRTSLAGTSTSMPSHLSCPLGTSILNDHSHSGEQLAHLSTNPSIDAQEMTNFSKTSRPTAAQRPHHRPQQHRPSRDITPETPGLPNSSYGSLPTSLQAPASKEPSIAEEEEEDDEDNAGSSGGDEEGYFDEYDGDEEDEEDEDGGTTDGSTDRGARTDTGMDRESSERSMASGAETIPWARPEASRTCVETSVYGSQYSSSSTTAASTNSGTGTTTQTTTPTTAITSRTTSLSALPSTLFYASAAGEGRRPSAGKRRRGSAQTRRASQQPQPMTASHNDMSMPFLFTHSGSFGAFPSPPPDDDDDVVAADDARDSMEPLQQSAVFSDMGFSYGGPVPPSTAQPSTAQQVRSSLARPQSRRRSLNRTSLSQMNVSTMHRQSSALASMLYSAIDNGSVPAGAVAELRRASAAPHGKAGMEGTFPSSMMYLYARTPSALNPRGGATLGSAAGNGRRRRGSVASTDSDSSGVTSSSSTSLSESGSGGEQTSFFRSTQEVWRRGNSAAARDGEESPPQRTLLPSGSGFATGLNMRVLRGDFRDEDASLDSRELARAAKRASGANNAPASAGGATTATAATSSSGAAAGASPGGTVAQAKVLSGASTHSTAGITPDSDNSNVPSGRSAGGTALPAVAATEAMRRRSSGTTFINFFRGAPAVPGRSTTSMTLSSGWGATQAPNASQQTVVGGWRLLSFRETDDTPLTNTENVPHDKAKKKSKKGKKGKKGKKKSGKARRAEEAAERAAEGEGGEEEERADHGDVAREVANAMMQNDLAPPQQQAQSSSPQQVQLQVPHPHSEGQRPGSAANAASAPPAQRVSNASGSHANTTSSTAGVASGMDKNAAQGPLLASSPTAATEAKDGRPRAPLPPASAPTQGRMRVARLPLRPTSVAVGAARTASPSRPVSSAAAPGADGASGGAAPNAGNRSAHESQPTSIPPSAGPTATAPPKKPAERFDKFKEPPLTSPSATVRRTTVRAAAGKPKVIISPSRRVNLGGPETTATGVRKFRPSAGPRLKAVMPPSSARTAQNGHATAASKPTPPPERLPPL